MNRPDPARFRDHPLYDVALAEICEGLNGFDEDEELSLDFVRETMVLCWMRGASWRDQHLDLSLKFPLEGD